jgi:hypothetical protein
MKGEEELRSWLRDGLGINEYRRVVRENAETVVVSKFEARFSQELFAVVDALPELLDDECVAAAYRERAAEYIARGEPALRTHVWREASEGLLRRLGEQRGITPRQLEYVLPGIESVQAVLDTVLWSAPTVLDDFAPSPGERQAYEEFLADDSGRIFTRYYGELAGKRVENYCPGSQFARRFMAQAYAICTA